jgi:hypothetical protein
MAKVATFTAELSIFKAIGQLKELDDKVNEFLRENDIDTVYSVSDTTTTDDKGKTMGIIRVLAYD